MNTWSRYGNQKKHDAPQKPKFLYAQNDCQTLRMHCACHAHYSTACVKFQICEKCHYEWTVKGKKH